MTQAGTPRKGVTPRPCPLCGASCAEPMFQRNGFDLVRCSRCALVFVAQDPTTIDFQQLYGEGYYRGGHEAVFADYTGQQAARRASARRRLWWLRRLERSVPASGRWLDVGCAAGFFLAEARRWYEVTGVELSPWSSRFAREQLGLDVFTGTLQDAALPPASFDVVSLWDVIEHVPDPVAVLAQAAQVLAPEGRLVLTTGDWGSAYAQSRGADWHLMTPPWHLSMFSRETLAAAAERAGLRVLSIRSEGVAGDGFLWRNPLSLVVTRALDRGDIMRATLAH